MSAHPAPASAQASLPDGGRFVALDSWRGLAAVGVAVGHLHGPGLLLSGPFHDNLSLAVDFFFVLSGFVIAASYGDRLAAGFSTLRFMILRYGRVWPLYACLVAVTVVLELGYAAFGGGVFAGREAFVGSRAPATLLPAALLADSWLPPGHSGWLSQSWSISVEVELYFAAALLWRFAGRAAAWLIPAGALAAIFALDARWAGEWSEVLRGVAGFGLGAAGWTVWRRIDFAVVPRRLLEGLELALLPAIALAIALRAPYALVDPLFLLVVLVFACEAGPVSRLLRLRPFVLLGTLSYSLYLVHALVYSRMFDAMALAQHALGVTWVSRTVGSAGVLLLGPWLSTAVALAMFAAALVAAWFAWRYVEWPAREWSRRYARRVGVAREELEAPTL